MLIRKIRAVNFRNILKTEVLPAERLNILVGENAQGKSNLLEILYLFTTGRSYRSRNTADLINFSASRAEIAVDLEKKRQNHLLEMKIEDSKRLVTIDNLEQKRVADLIGHLNTVSFFPRDLSLITGGPSGRRNFIDMEISQVRPLYYRVVNNYNRIILQRNKLLKQKQRADYLAGLLSTYDEKLVDLGSRIIKSRLETLYKINILARLAHRQLTDTRENLNIQYQSSIGLSGEIANLHKVSFEEIVELLTESLNKARSKEIERRQTLIGPHLDDFTLSINHRDVKRFGSQGQVRTAAISLKLAELQFMRSETGELPILILDDVLSELDKDRQHLLLDSASTSAQTFVATTDISLLNKSIISNAKIFRVKDGIFTEE